MSFIEHARPRDGSSLGAWPELVVGALSSCPILSAALERWSAARQRLGLSRHAEVLGALLLSCELDQSTHRSLLGEEHCDRAPTRAHLLAAARGTASDDLVADALVELETRGIVETSAHANGPWFAAPLSVAARVRDHCLTRPSAPRRLDPARREPALSSRVLSLLDEVARTLDRDSEQACAVVIRGGYGAGRDTVARELLARVGRAHVRKTPYDLRGPLDPLEPELGGFATLWDARRSDPSPEDYELAARWLARSPTVALALLDRQQDAPDSRGRRTLLIEVDPDSREERVEIWRRALCAAGAKEAAASDAAALLGRRSRAGAGLAARATPVESCAPLEGSELSARAERRVADLALPSQQRGVIVEQPRIELARLIVARGVETSLRQLMVLSKTDAESDRRGAKALFSGASGTGKTLAARAVASELGRPLFRVDLASITSKWIGETERNLRQALEAAEASGAVLLFDEGDALLAKRGEVSRGTDRYANLEVSYLLQAFEAHDGVVIVTTNLKQNLDPAFQRRFDVTVDFSLPDSASRAKLWTQELGSFGRGAPWDGLLEELCAHELSGGNIAAAARLAIAIALDRGHDRVGPAELCSAMAAELYKLNSSVQGARWTQKAERHA